MITGLSSRLGLWLEQTIDEVLVRVTNSGEETLVALARDGWSALVIDHSLSGLPAPDAVSLARDELDLTRMPIFYCLETTAGNDIAAGIASRIGLGQLVFHPINWVILAQRIELTIGEISYHMGNTNHNTARLFAPFLHTTTPSVEENADEFPWHYGAMELADAITRRDYADAIANMNEEKLLDFDTSLEADAPS